MTIAEYLEQGQLKEALRAQVELIQAQPEDAKAQLTLFELSLLAGHHQNAARQLRSIRSEEESWAASQHFFWQLVRADYRRHTGSRRPRFFTPPAEHVRHRWNAYRALLTNNSRQAMRQIDYAELRAPTLQGFWNGQEFDELRDTDDRLAGVCEIYLGRHWVWVPLEQIRTLRLQEPKTILEMAFRQGKLKLQDHREYNVFVPVLYAHSASFGEEFALGQEVDWTADSGGPVLGIGAKVWTVGDADEPLQELQMLEIRPV